MQDSLKLAALDAPNQAAFDKTTFRQLDLLADLYATDLVKRGIKPGDIIAFRTPPSAECAALFFAAWRIGASICPLSLRLPPTQIEPHLQRVKANLYIDRFPIDPKLRNQNACLPFPGVLLFTSGSTGLPKIAFLSIGNLENNAKGAIDFLQLKENDRWLLNLPLYHVGGIGVVLRCILAKATVVLQANDLSITHVSAVPTQLYRSVPVYKNLRCLLVGGAPISSYPKSLPCWLSYGLTEMGSLVSAESAQKKKAPPFELGLPLKGREIRCIENEIQVRGECLFQGYWEDGKWIKPFTADGWFPTGDLGSITKGKLTIFGRKDWQFISGGENIQPEEIESELLSVQGIHQAVVVPLPDPEFGQRPIAAIQRFDPSLTERKISAALMDKLPKFKLPIRYVFLEELPKTGLKINRAAVIRIVLNTTPQDSHP